MTAKRSTISDLSHQTYRRWRMAKALGCRQVTLDLLWQAFDAVGQAELLISNARRSRRGGGS
jgi:hypothetical protein